MCERAILQFRLKEENSILCFIHVVRIHNGHIIMRPLHDHCCTTHLCVTLSDLLSDLSQDVQRLELVD